MGSIRTFNPVKLFVGVLVSDRSHIPAIKARMAALYGTIDHESPLIPFDFTDYYTAEMGDIIDRVFFSFERLIEADQLAGIKRTTNDIEAEFASNGNRPVNLDPGYIEHAKVILASTKNFYHRIYLERGIFAEVTMHFRNNTFQFFPWTYPDYQSRDYQEFFLRIRHIYRSQLKTMCILNREEST
jgi:hypothetical protein